MSEKEDIIEQQLLQPLFYMIAWRKNSKPLIFIDHVLSLSIGLFMLTTEIFQETFCHICRKYNNGLDPTVLQKGHANKPDNNQQYLQQGSNQKSTA